uniref:Uncharacterized protein n=1 Tax=Anopheles atroparvus TaxID=41427 RepID=A0A182IM22_ANOAO
MHMWGGVLVRRFYHRRCAEDRCDSRARFSSARATAGPILSHCSHFFFETSSRCQGMFSRISHSNRSSSYRSYSPSVMGNPFGSDTASSMRHMPDNKLIIHLPELGGELIEQHHVVTVIFAGFLKFSTRMYDSSKSENGSDRALRLESDPPGDARSSLAWRDPPLDTSSTDRGRRRCRMLSENACRISGSSLEPETS